MQKVLHLLRDDRVTLIEKGVLSHRFLALFYAASLLLKNCLFIDISIMLINKKTLLVFGQTISNIRNSDGNERLSFFSKGKTQIDRIIVSRIKL